jgi:hypothetical protein
MASVESGGGSSPLKVWHGMPYVSVAGVGALLSLAVVWGTTTKRLDVVEDRVSKVETSAREVASKDDVQRVERRLERIEQMLIDRSKALP